MDERQQLEREAAGRPWAIAGAAGAAILPLAGSIAALLLFRELRSPDDTSRLIFVHDHAGSVIAIAVIQALGALFLVPLLVYLYRAVKARRPETPEPALVCAFAGPVGYCLAQIGVQAVLVHKTGTFIHTDTTYEDARHVIRAGSLKALQGLSLGATFALAFAFVLISLNAMRVGLLTRFMGVLGIIVGVLLVIPAFPLPVVQTFWLGAVGYLISGRWPGGLPPAWRTGRAEPWPSQQELRERREGESAKRRPEPAPRAEPVAEAAGASGETRPHPSSRKRKRKRKR